MEDTKGTVERVGGYRVVRRLATGGTSDVLLAKAEGPHGFERTVVLKLLLSQYRNDEEFAKMFAREAAAYARLSHPAIVQLYDFFQLDGQLVMVLEYVDGAPLSRLRGMLKAVGQNIDDRASLFIAQRIFSALAAAHESTGDGGVPTPVIHRDVNPTNVLVPWDGHVKLADFGIAKVTGVTHESAAGLIKGTYGYMAPEQVEGGQITPRADVYAAGIILWELLTRRRAFQRGALPEIEVLRAMAEPRITPIDILRPDVDSGVREAISRCLKPKAAQRNITAEEMVEVLRGVVSPDEGRERLVQLLSSVRHEPKPMPTSMPPPQTDPMPNAPAFASPSPSPSPKPGGVGLKPPRPIGPPRPASKPALPAVSAPPTTKRGSGMLPAVTPPPTPKIATKPAESAPQLVESEMRDSEKMRLATPLQQIAPGLTLKDAIDEILTSVPSSIPPSVLSSRLPMAMPAKPAYPDSSSPPPAGPETPRMIPLPTPPKPPVLNVTMPLGMALSPLPGATQPAPPIPADPSMPPVAPLVSEPPQIAQAIASALRPDFDQTVREIERAEQPTVMPPRDAEPLDRTLSLDPEANKSTSKVPAYQLPPQPPPQMAAPPAPEPLPPAHGSLSPILEPLPAMPHVPPSAASSPPIANTGPHDAILPQPKPSSVGVIAFMVVIVIAAGVAGTVFYVRHQKTKQPTTIATTAPPATTSVAAPFVPPTPTEPPSASVAPTATAEPVASASASAAPSATATASATASAPPVASASATPAGDIPAGMGIVHTTGAAPNRRIFVDDKTVGQTPESVTVKCGTRTVKLGSAGKPQSIDIPCGGEITVSDVK